MGFSESADKISEKTNVSTTPITKKNQIRKKHPNIFSSNPVSQVGWRPTFPTEKLDLQKVKFLMEATLIGLKIQCILNWFSATAGNKW